MAVTTTTGPADHQPIVVEEHAPGGLRALDVRKLGMWTFLGSECIFFGALITAFFVNRPIVADFDEEGRLYVADSSGSNDKVEKQLADKPHRIVRLEDKNGDGRFDSSVVFADKMMFPEGAM